MDVKAESKNVNGKITVNKKHHLIISKSDDDSANEFGWCCGALRAGMSSIVVEAILTERASERRGADAPRYAKRTVAAALASL